MTREELKQLANEAINFHKTFPSEIDYLSFQAERTPRLARALLKHMEMVEVMREELIKIKSGDEYNLGGMNRFSRVDMMSFARQALNRVAELEGEL